MISSGRRIRVGVGLGSQDERVEGVVVIIFMMWNSRQRRKRDASNLKIKEER